MSEPIPSDAVVPSSPEPPTEVTASADGDADGLGSPSFVCGPQEASSRQPRRSQPTARGRATATPLELMTTTTMTMTSTTTSTST